MLDPKVTYSDLALLQGVWQSLIIVLIDLLSHLYNSAYKQIISRVATLLFFNS